MPRSHLAAIHQIDAVKKIFPQPGKIFFRARSIHDEQKFLGSSAVNDQVVDNTAAFIEKKRILAGPNVQFRNIVGKHLVKPAAGVRARGDQLTHV